MKVSSFKKFLEEEDSKAIVQTGLNSKSIDNSVTKEIINSRLANTTSNPFLTPYIALGSIARILAYVNIVVPQYTFLDRDEGEVVFDATQVGQIAGVNMDGSPAKSEADHFIYFSYSMNDDGYYDCFAALVDSDELEDIMDMGGDDDVDQLDVDQKVNEEQIEEATRKEYGNTKHFTGKKYKELRKAKDPLQNRENKSPKQLKAAISRSLGKHGSAGKLPEELTGNQHKIDVAEPKGKLTSADFKKLRGEEVDEGFDKWHNKLKKRNWLRKKGYEKSPVDSTSPSNTAALAVRAGRDKLKTEAMKHDETSHATLPAMKQDSPKGHDEAAVWHDKMANQARSFSNNRDLQFHVKRGAHHRTQAAAMRSQGMGKQVDEQSINERKSSDPKGLAYKVTAASHAAHPEWGPADHTQDPKTHFGTAATRSSTLAAVRAIRSHIASHGGFDVNNPDHVDAVAKDIHGSPEDYKGKPRGWSQTALTHSGQSPEQKERRAKLTGPYDSLSDAEKEKDREIVRTVAANMPTKKEEPTNPATQAAQELKNRIAAHQESKPQPVRKPAVASSSKSEPSIEDAAKRVKAAPQNPAAQELKARIAAHQQTKKSK